jgi:hypothetical protein
MKHFFKVVAMATIILATSVAHAGFKVGGYTMAEIQQEVAKTFSKLEKKTKCYHDQENGPSCLENTWHGHNFPVSFGGTTNYVVLYNNYTGGDVNTGAIFVEERGFMVGPLEVDNKYFAYRMVFERTRPMHGKSVTSADSFHIYVHEFANGTIAEDGIDINNEFIGGVKSNHLMAIGRAVFSLDDVRRQIKRMR